MEPPRKPQRIDSLDLIRGIAICGLAPINIQDFATPDDWLFVPGDFSGLDMSLWLMVSVLGVGKFITLFSLLFGASMILQVQGLERRDLPIAKTYLPRLGWLWFFGMLHAYLIWWGDILVGYAVTGFVVFWCRNWSAKTLALVGAIVHLAVLFIMAAGISLIFLTGSGDMLESDFSEDEIGGFWDMEAMSGSWLEQMPQRAAVTALIHVFGIPLIIFPLCGSLMLLGMALFKSGFFEFKWQKSTYQKICGGFLAVGIGISLAGVGFSVGDGWTINAILKYSVLAIPVTPLIALGYAAAMELWSQTSLANWLQSGFKAVGRMAFSNYIAQSLIFTLVFYGSGLGMYGKLEFTEVMLICPCVWIFQIIFSCLWLRRFRLGPLEWIWRSLTGLKRV